MTATHPHRARLTRVSIALACLAAVARTQAGDATLQAGNSPVSTNLTSVGTLLDAEFRFEIGTFGAGLAPGPMNVAEWLGHWHPVSDSGGQPLPEATVVYDDSELGLPFPPGTHANQFSTTVTLTHNLPPFAANSAVYIWGFDRREGEGTAEWILLANPDWRWPTIVPGSEPVIRTFDVSHPDTFAIVGEVNGEGFEMRTGAVALSAPPSGYELWLAEAFAPEDLADPALESTRWGFATDADGDGIPNAIEFLSGTVPTRESSRPEFTVVRSGSVLKLVFTRLKDSGAITGGAEWSTDLLEWSGEGVAETVLEDLGDRERIEAGVAVPGEGRAFMRLIASEAGAPE